MANGGRDERTNGFGRRGNDLERSVPRARTTRMTFGARIRVSRRDRIKLREGIAVIKKVYNFVVYIYIFSLFFIHTHIYI